MLKIVTDGSADMPPEWQEEYGIDVIPLGIQFGNEGVLMQGPDLHPGNFYRMVMEKRLAPKTSLPSPFQIMEFYRRIASKGDEILSIHLASKLSGTFAAVQSAAKELAEEFKITTFDSAAGSAALGFMCREARLMDRQGEPVERILRRLDETRKRLAIIFTLENLEFATLSGRISRLQSALSSILRINPIIVLRDGMLSMGDKVRTRQKALDRVIEEIHNRMGQQKIALAIVHAAAPETAQFMLEKVKTLLPAAREIIVTDLSIPVSAHLGPGTIGIVAYPIVEGNEPK